MARGDNLKEDSKKTRWKKGQKPPTNGVAAWSVRAALKHIAAQRIDPDKLDAEIKKLLKKTPQAKCPVAHMIAVRLTERIIKKAEPTMMQPFLDNLEGRLQQDYSIIPPRTPEVFDPEHAERRYSEAFKKPI